MLKKRKLTKKYYFSVEGETEKWYLEWLRDTINAEKDIKAQVALDCKIEKDPVSRVKGISGIIAEITIWHLSDYESDSAQHAKQFKTTMDNMAKAMTLGKQVIYKFGYSNFTFDLWMLLHKSLCYGSFSDRKQYLSPLNQAFGEKFENMNQFKHEKNFKRCLKQLTLKNVIEAVARAKDIMKQRNDQGCSLHSYKGFEYYKENPSLAVHEIVEKILKDCGYINLK